MSTLFESLSDNQHLQSVLGWLALFSSLTFVLSLLFIPWIIGRLPRDCFLKPHAPKKGGSIYTLSGIIILLLRNLLGLLLLAAGFAMLFLPGQGLLTILMGCLLISFPGKDRLINNLVHRPKIQQSMDWLRKKRGKSPFDWPQKEGEG